MPSPLNTDAAHADGTDRETPCEVVKDILNILTRWYYFWFIVYVLLGIASIGLPGAAATLISDPIWVKIFAGLGAITAAVFAFLRPNELASAYDAATTAAWKVSVPARLGLLSEEQAVERLQDAIDKVGMKYGGLPNN